LPTGGLRAIKTLPSEACFEDRARFAREVGALAQLDGHPHVVRVHAAGVEGSHPYLVLDLAPGGDLAQRLERGPLPPADARRILLELAEGLGHVHRHRLLHRDLKPQNVLFAEDGRALLADFGLVRGSSRSSLTQTGAVLGTPSYMAPEQVRGEPLDPRADVYALGAILYHALTGRPPFAGNAFAVLQAIVGSSPQPVLELERQADPRLVAICERAMAKDPAARYASAAELAAALRAAEEPPSRVSRAPLAVAGALALTATLGLIGVFARPPRSRAPEADPAGPRERDRTAPPNAPGVRQAQALAELERRLQERRAQVPAGALPGEAAAEGLRRLAVGEAEEALRCFLHEAKHGDPHGWSLLAEHLGALPGVAGAGLLREACLRRGLEQGSAACALELGGALAAGAGSDSGLRLAAAELYVQAVSFKPPAPELQLAMDPGRAAKRRLVELCALEPEGFPLPLDTVLEYAQECFAAEPDRVRRAALQAPWLALGEACCEELRRSLPAPSFSQRLGAFDARAVGQGTTAHMVARVAWERRDYGQAAAWAFRAAAGATPDPQGWIDLYEFLQLPAFCEALQVGPARAHALQRALVERALREGAARGYEHLGNAHARGIPRLLIVRDPRRALTLLRGGLDRSLDTSRRGGLSMALAWLAATARADERVLSKAEGRSYLQAALDAGRQISPEELENLRALLAGE
ncbi:MAG: serine/threonine protein kinase, partial [Planctomycetes bacterium]|nr:serine/threonine protein kinase [Planctomycetota bacterium]